MLIYSVSNSNIEMDKTLKYTHNIKVILQM